MAPSGGYIHLDLLKLLKQRGCLKKKNPSSAKPLCFAVVISYRVNDSEDKLTSSGKGDAQRQLCYHHTSHDRQTREEGVWQCGVGMQQIAHNIQCTNAPHSCAYTPGSQQGLQRQRMLRPAGLSMYIFQTTREWRSAPTGTSTWEPPGVID